MTSWIPDVDGSDFDLNNLPLGVFSPPAESARPGVAVGTYIADLEALAAAGLIEEPALRGRRTLNAFLAAGRARWSALRSRLQYLLSERAAMHERVFVEAALVPREGAIMYLPVEIGDVVDFYSSIEHATNVGRLFRPEHPLADNYRSMPVGYHGRSSAVVIDGTLIPRPAGQYMSSGDAVPTFGPAKQLDFELELGAIVGTGNAPGEPIPIDRVRDHVYGYVVLDDWSARDVQAWETAPLGPFLSKSFATSISPWIVSLDALEPFRVENREIDPAPFPYLRTAERWAYDIELDVLLQTRRMRAAGVEPASIVRTNFRSMYWHLAQQIAHLTSNGSRIRPGDLCGSGTISGSEPGTFGSLLEATYRGTQPLVLPNGEHRTFLVDGDTVIMRARAEAGERRVGFGEVRGTIVG